MFGHDGRNNKTRLDHNVVDYILCRAQKGPIFLDFNDRSSLDKELKPHIDLLRRKPFDFRVILFLLSEEIIDDDTVRGFWLIFSIGIRGIVVIPVDSETS